jgi:Fur family transcriptional regulator, ferric uptake regulator
MMFIKISERGSVMDENLNLLKENGYKLTRQRCKILKALEVNSSLSADEILAQIHGECSVNLSTIYRNLHILLEMGLIRKANNIGQADHFELIRHHCTHALLCLECGEKVLFSECVFDQMLNEIESKTKFKVKHHNFEIYGLCPKCNV